MIKGFQCHPASQSYTPDDVSTTSSCYATSNVYARGTNSSRSIRFFAHLRRTTVFCDWAHSWNVDSMMGEEHVQKDGQIICVFIKVINQDPRPWAPKQTVSSALAQTSSGAWSLHRPPCPSLASPLPSFPTWPQTTPGPETQRKCSWRGRACPMLPSSPPVDNAISLSLSLYSATDTIWI